MPSWSRIFLKKSAARASLPGGLVVSIRRYSRCHCTARSAYCFRRSGGMLSEASVCLVVAVWDEPSNVDAARTNPRKQTPTSLLDIPSSWTIWFVPAHFLYQHRQNYPEIGFLFPSLSPTGLQCYCRPRG